MLHKGRRSLVVSWLCLWISSYLVLKIFFFWQTLGRAQIRWKVQQILGNLHRRKRYKSYPKDLYFLCRKTLRNGREHRQERYLSMRRLSNLSPFGNLSHVVFFSVDLFSSLQGLWILRVQSLETQIPSHKNCIVLNCFWLTFPDNNSAIVSSCHVYFACWLLQSSCYVRTQISRGQKALWSLPKPRKIIRM